MGNKIYLAGSMQYTPRDEYCGWRNQVRDYMTEFTIINPADFYHYGANYHKTEREILLYELGLVRKSSVVLVNLANIRKSIGTCDEVLYAAMNRIPVIGFLETEEEMSEEDIMTEIHPWKYYQINRIETGKDAMKKAMDYIKGYYVF